MTKSISSSLSPPPQRLQSLDFLRGVVMVILLLGETNFFGYLAEAFPYPFTRFLFSQFVHSDWRGLRFWDILLPAFMFVGGTSMAFSYKKQQQLDYSLSQYYWKIIKRSGWLFFWGVMIYAVRKHHFNFEASNVLVQLAIATLIASLIIRAPAWIQLTVSLLCLLIPELLFRFSQVPGFDQPFTDQHNFGNYVDLLLIKRLNPGASNTMNAIPSAAHTIWGLMAGQLLLTTKSNRKKFIQLSVSGALAIAAGLLLDLTEVTPMLKWIASSSFVLVTTGITLIALALCYEWIDVRQHQRNLRFFTIVGMNSIFIYLFYNFIGFRWMYEYLSIVCSGIFHKVGIPLSIGVLISSLVAFAIEWGLCYFLYRKKIFFKL